MQTELRFVLISRIQKTYSIGLHHQILVLLVNTCYPILIILGNQRFRQLMKKRINFIRIKY